MCNRMAEVTETKNPNIKNINTENISCFVPVKIAESKSAVPSALDPEMRFSFG